MTNRVFRINGQFNIVTRTERKIIWLSLPELIPITKYYTRSNFIQIMGEGSLMVIDNNSINCINVNLPPLTFNLYKQDILNWQPTGGISLSIVTILYDQHIINFYQPGQNLIKTWTIQVMQQITQIKTSQQQKILGMIVKQKKNTIFLWNLQDISGKPFQEITISEEIVKWEFYNKEMLVILTRKQIEIYCQQQGKYSIYFFYQLAQNNYQCNGGSNTTNHDNIHKNNTNNVINFSVDDSIMNNINNIKKNQQIFIDFCFLHRPKTNQHSGRRTVYPIAILSNSGNILIYQLYDIDKRMKNSQANLLKTIQCPKDTQKIICGYEKQNLEVIICAESKSTKPFTILLNSLFQPLNKWEFLPQLNTQNSKFIQYCKDIICTCDHHQSQELINNKEQHHQQNQSLKQYNLYKIIGKQQFEFINQYHCNGFSILGGYNFFCFNQNSIIIYDKSFNFTKQHNVTLPNIKVPKNLLLLQEKQSIAYFIAGIKLYRLDIANKTFKPSGFTVKNDKLSLQEVRNQTRSLLYKLNEQYILMEYTTPNKPQIESQKTTVKTIKSCENPLVSLRNSRWAERKIDRIVIGEGNKILVQFDLGKFFKQLTQQSTLLDYNIYWTTHNGILLMIKNYIFVLQLTESTDGYSLALVKRSNNYLHIRLNPDIDDLQIMDARSAIIKQGKRIMKFGNKFGNFVSEDPYQLPDTLLRRQLLMRKMYPPHHPKIIQYLIQQGYFNLLQKLFENIWKWMKQDKTITELYQRIGVDFYKQNSQITEQNSLIVSTKDINEKQSQIDKKLCELILQNPNILNLEQNGSLILQSQIQALIFKKHNSRSIDAYSSIILTQYKTFYGKNEDFATMNIAFMLHSINKQQAIDILRQQKKQLDWDWIKKFSIVIWYENKIQIQNWAEQIGTNLFKCNKDPMDCLFWYTVAGKKNILIQLFKKYTFNSAEHEAIFKFLQRDFTQLKNQNAAVKNGYVLIDKKRYLHALAFFIYGQKLDEAISLCLNKLRDINLAFLICTLHDDTTNRNRLLSLLLKQGDVWAKHIAYYLKNQHIDSFNCLFEQQDIEIINNWIFQPKLTSFHPSLKAFAELIEKSIPVKRQLQAQQSTMSVSEPQDIFASFYQSRQITMIQQQKNQKKLLSPNYEQLKKQSIAYFIRNNCSVIALMLDPTNYNAKRSYDLCQFMQTKQVNTTVYQLISQMEDYQSIIKTLAMEGKTIKLDLERFQDNFKKVYDGLWFTSTTVTQKGRIGQLMHYSYLAVKLIAKIKNKQYRLEQNSNHICKNIQALVDVSILYLILELQIYQKIQQFANYLITPNSIPLETKTQNLWNQQFWQLLKMYYDKIVQFKKNKKQNLYDSFEQILYKYMYKKGQITNENTNFKLATQNCVSMFIKKICIESFITLLNQKNDNKQASTILQSLLKNINIILFKWSQQNAFESLNKQFNIMLTEGVSSKLKLQFLPTHLNLNFQILCRALLATKNKQNKQNIQKNTGKSSQPIQKINKGQVVQIFRNKHEIPRFFAINKNEGQGIELVLITKKNIKKFEICESLVNRNRSQDGITLLNNQDIVNQIDNPFNFSSIGSHPHPLIIEKFLSGIKENRKQYDGMGIIKGSTKRSSLQYLKPGDSAPPYQISDINCIECHHFLPIYLLGVKTNIQLCTFDKNKNYNRIKCPGMSEIIKIKSYEQRATVLDSSGNLSSYSFDSKVSGNCVFQLKKTGIIDFCQMTPTTYGICTSSGMQVIDSLVHPKRQIVFKTQTNQTPTAVSYFNANKLAVCRKSDLLIYDIRKDIQQSTRDLAGRAKCMISNYRDRILVGKTDNKVRVVDLSAANNAQDYDVKCISYKPNDTAPDKASIQNIDIMGRLAIALNSQGTMSVFSVE